MKMSMRFILRRTLPALAAAVAICGSAQGAVLYQQAPLIGGLFYVANYSINDVSGTQNADSFSVGAGTSITGIRWWGTEAEPQQFVVRLLPSTLGASNGSPLFGTVAATDTNQVGFDNVPIFMYELELDSPMVVPDALPRFVSVFLDSTDIWGWIEDADARGDGVSSFRGQDDADWVFPLVAPDLAFAILGERQQPPIPEPGILALLAAGGLAGFALRRASKRRAFAVG